MNKIKKGIYRFFAPLLRNILGKKISKKKIAGSQMWLYYERNQHLGLLFHKDVRYEREFSKIILQHIEKDDLVFEIGSNIGQYSLLIAEKIGVNGRLLCIEPDSDNFACLAFNIYKNRLKQVEILNVAVGEKTGQATFYKDTMTGGRMSSLFMKYASDHFKGITEEVRVITLRELIEKFGIPQFIKVDVEGAESMIFSDASLIDPGTKFLIEVRDETKEYIFNLFKNKQFKIMVLGEKIFNADKAEQIPGFANLLIMK
ncbi:MAG: FkbM family methyltransferase [Saprospiraceae bacterium]